MPEYIHVEEIRRILEDEISGDISKFSLDTILALNEAIKKFLKAIENWQSLAKSKLKSHMITYKDPKDQELYSKLRSVEKKKALEDILIEGRGTLTAEGLLKEGYILIDNIRSKLIGEKINYSIGVQYKGSLYEGSVSIEDILSQSKVVIDGNTLDSIVKLRIYGSKSKWISLMEIENNGIAFVNNHSSLFTSIRDYSNKNKIKNWGNIYETYKLLVHRHKSNKIPPAHFDEKEFIAAYLETVKNTASFVQGGDILNEQVKFFGGTAPSLVSLSTIKNTLTRLSKALSTANIEIIEQEVKRIFTKSEQPKRAAEDLEEEVLKYIDQHIKKNLENNN